jgi:hypothetical protein
MQWWRTPEFADLGLMLGLMKFFIGRKKKRLLLEILKKPTPLTDRAYN